MVALARKSLLILLLLPIAIIAESPFSPKLSVWFDGNRQFAELTINGPQDGHIDAESLELTLPDGAKAKSIESPSPDNDGYFPVDSTFRWEIDPPVNTSDISASFQGCTGSICYMPESVLPTGDSTQERSISAPSAIPNGFRISAPLAGYHNADDFLKWIDNSISGETTNENLLERVFAKGGWILAGLMTILLGILLNLTPCVLPMIPITLGILGAKSAGAGRLHGAMLGGCYGGAMAVTYGLAGAIVVVFGGRFGAINSSAIFQFVLAVVFVLLALAMFDCLMIDLSRFRTLAKMNFTAGSYGAALFLGVLAALLAGACVAPVLIWVLLLSTRLYADGANAALLLPLLLGAGLGLPWPLLGAGIGALPKPGAWMNNTKKAFGILILLFAAYTFWNGVKLLGNSRHDKAIWKNNYSEAVAEAISDRKPILLDFWGVSCKACDLMDAKTFRNPKVLQRLGEIHCVGIQADLEDNSSLTDSYGIKGMPTYILLIPN